MLAAVLRAVGAAFASQRQAPMLALLGIPLLVALGFWGLIALFLWDPWLAMVSAWAASAPDWLKPFAQAASGTGGILSWVLAILLILPLMFVLAVALTGVLAMPVVMRYLSSGAYQGVQRRGTLAPWPSITNALVALAIFVPGYLLTLPLWFIPGLALLVPWLWWGWFTARVMRLDSLLEHADESERAQVVARHRRAYLLLGILLTGLNYIPPLFLITPVLSALAFGHYSLRALAELRGVRVSALELNRPGSQ